MSEDKQQKTYRGRIAPTPSGYLHEGHASTFKVSWSRARERNGDIVYRNDDLDKLRCQSEFSQAAMQDLKSLKINWDEGPDCGGQYGPYRQSERLDLYEREINRLIENGRAYLCFCTPQRLNELRAKQIANKETPRYDGLCLSLSPEESARRAKSEPFVVRMKIPESGTCEFTDELRGQVSIEWAQIDHQVIRKSDGFPTYHLANVVDDHEMAISHVIRGEEWISSTPKHVLLYQ